MAQKSAFDVLQETLRELGYEPKTHVSGRNFIVPGSYVRTKFVYAEVGGMCFFASDSHGGAYTSTYTGLYAPIDLPAEADFSAFRKEWFDKLFVSGKQKTGITYVDKALTIKSPGWNPGGLFNPDRVDRFLELGRGIKPLKLVVRDEYVPLAALQGKKVIGIETNRWLFYKKDVRTFLDGAAGLIASFQAV